MLTIIHGDNPLASRQKLQQLRTKFTTANITELDADNLTVAALETALAAKNLFTEQEVLVIENLFSLPKSKKKDELISLVIDATKEVICWEKKLLPATTLKKATQATIFVHKLSSKLWTFLDQLAPQAQAKKQLQLLQEVLERDGAELCFAMLSRQIRLLIRAKENDLADLAPFLRSKLQKQAKNFSLSQLLQAHQQLFAIEEQNKTSRNLLSLGQQLDLWLLSL